MMTATATATRSPYLSPFFPCSLPLSLALLPLPHAACCTAGSHIPHPLGIAAHAGSCDSGWTQLTFLACTPACSMHAGCGVVSAAGPLQKRLRSVCKESNRLDARLHATLRAGAASRAGAPYRTHACAALTKVWPVSPQLVCWCLHACTARTFEWHVMQSDATWRPCTHMRLYSHTQAGLDQRAQHCSLQPRKGGHAHTSKARRPLRYTSAESRHHLRCAVHCDQTSDMPSPVHAGIGRALCTTGAQLWGRHLCISPSVQPLATTYLSGNTNVTRIGLSQG